MSRSHAQVFSYIHDVLCDQRYRLHLLKNTTNESPTLYCNRNQLNIFLSYTEFVKARWSLCTLVLPESLEFCRLYDIAVLTYIVYELYAPEQQAKYVSDVKSGAIDVTVSGIDYIFYGTILHDWCVLNNSVLLSHMAALFNALRYWVMADTASDWMITFGYGCHMCKFPNISTQVKVVNTYTVCDHISCSVDILSTEPLLLEKITDTRSDMESYLDIIAHGDATSDDISTVPYQLLCVDEQIAFNQNRRSMNKSVTKMTQLVDTINDLQTTVDEMKSGRCISPSFIQMVSVACHKLSRRFDVLTLNRVPAIKVCRKLQRVNKCKLKDAMDSFKKRLSDEIELNEKNDTLTSASRADTDRILIDPCTGGLYRGILRATILYRYSMISHGKDSVDITRDSVYRDSLTGKTLMFKYEPKDTRDAYILPVYVINMVQEIMRGINMTNVPSLCRADDLNRIPQEYGDFCILYENKMLAYRCKDTLYYASIYRPEEVLCAFMLLRHGAAIDGRVTVSALESILFGRHLDNTGFGFGIPI